MSLLDKTAAARVKEVILGLSRQLDESVEFVLQRWQSPRASLYRRLVGQVMGLLHTNIMVPIYQIHPDLEPEELATARARAEPTPPMPKELADQLLALLDEVRLGFQEVALVVERTGEAEATEALEKASQEIFAQLGHTKTFIDRASRQHLGPPSKLHD